MHTVFRVLTLQQELAWGFADLFNPFFGVVAVFSFHIARCIQPCLSMFVNIRQTDMLVLIAGISSRI